MTVTNRAPRENAVGNKCGVEKKITVSPATKTKPPAVNTKLTSSDGDTTSHITSTSQDSLAMDDDADVAHNQSMPTTS